MAAAAIIAAPAAAYAVDTTIEINPGNVPTTAAEFEDQSCDQVPDEIADDQDGWVFVLPSQMGAKGEFVRVDATFEDQDGATHEFNTDEHGGIDGGQGTSKAFIITPAGWTLITAFAEVTGVDSNKAMFNLTHTCPGEAPPPNGETPSPTPSQTPSETPSESPSQPASTTTAGMTTSSEDAAALPTTGSGLTAMLLTAAVLLGAGMAVFILMRRRAAEPSH